MALHSSSTNELCNKDPFGWHPHYSHIHLQPFYRYDLVVIGGGPGGYTTAIKAAQLGLRVACVEKRKTLGGTCLNCGCIPSKALLNTSHNFEKLKKGIPGIVASSVSVDVKKMMDDKDSILRTLNMGIQGLFRKNKVDFIQGHGKIVDANKVAVEDKIVETENIIIATGSEVTPFPHESLKVDGKFVLSSTEALCLDKVPKEMVVIGGGAIGLELASVWSRLGAKVDILEFAPDVCSVMDVDVSKNIKRILEKQGLKIHVNTKVLKGEIKGDKITIHAESAGKPVSFTAEKVLIAMGRRPYTEGLGLEALNVETKQGRIPVDDQFRVSDKSGAPVSSVRAIGDVITGPMLAHKAEEDGMAALGYIVNQDLVHVDHNLIPSVIYTHPEIAGVGATEQSLVKEGKEFKKGVFSYMGNSRAKIYGESDGFVKILADKENKILGAWIVGPDASELIAQLTIAVTYGASTVDVTRTCFAHPSLSEAVKEACLAVHSKPIHM
ncbi:dihydrolipoyl dehydrogenase family protein [Theileria equi strain WA]|uniref:Dihydrolipoyl dehydrogenase n=1 Tax=Theileria equi strain WA TaxID=1537102 RepID=L1LCS1_THEEQ|nr:dihydrolipoyl dehydrogenase family protein [Theileria equi strain WA]EKX73045.1 dihydrolipoyl dehydrogenase family protein [Theileria equi strain WA]|eukprot:XP_004832497.1 dihydrolipoyl dehydrogenase family protein [Theileria equi strain WA]